MKLPSLGVNIDHVATLRQLRGTPYPDLTEAYRLVAAAGAQQITVHLREDRRHIQDDDVKRLHAEHRLKFNLELAATDEMVKIARRIGPNSVCLVPEKRAELTTEGGLDIEKNQRRLASAIERLKKASIFVSCFIEPNLKDVRLSREIGADAVEFHTGRYCLAEQRRDGQARAARELERLRGVALFAKKQGLHAHAGHGFDYENVRKVAKFQDEHGEPLIEEYNIGHSIVCRAVLVGMERAVREMLSAIHAP